MNKHRPQKTADRALLRKHRLAPITVALALTGQGLIADVVTQPTRVFDQHAANYTFWTAAFSPDGLRVCSGMYSGAFVWEAETGNILLKLEVSGPTSVAFSPDGERLLTGGWDDPIVRLWNTGNGTVVSEFQGHSSGITGVAFSPDGRTILTGSYDRTARLWDVETGGLVRNIGEHPRRVRSVAFSPDGTQVLTGASDWDDTNYLSITRLWDLNTGDLVRSFEGGHQCEFSPDGSQVRTGDSLGPVRVWDVSSGNLLQSFSFGGAFDFSPDGKMILLFNAEPTSAGGQATLWDTASGQLLRSFPYNGEWIRAAFWPGGKHVLTCGDDGVARLWDIRDLIARPRMNPGASGPEIQWDLGTLQFAPAINGPWTDLPAASPFQLSPTGDKGFFRVKVSD